MPNDSDAEAEAVELVLDQPTAAEMVREARRRYGTGGAIVAALGLGIDEAVLGRAKRDSGSVVVDAPGEPGDVDRDGLLIDVDDQRAVHSQPLERRAPLPAAKRRRARRPAQ